MPGIHALTVVVVSAVLATAASADGLVYQLPRDGSWVRYKLEARGPSKDADGKLVVSMKGTVTVSSVGVAKVGNEPCRWIEVAVDAKRDGQAFSDVDKVLIPEKNIGRGKFAHENVIALWHARSAVNEGTPREVENHADRFQRHRPLHLALHPPFENEKNLEKKVVEGKLGKLECDGISATETQKNERSNIEHQSSYAIRTHPTAPFGVVTWHATYVFSRDGQVLNTWTLELTLSDIGQDAKSRLKVQK